MSGLKVPGHDQQDADIYAEQGIGYLKYHLSSYKDLQWPVPAS
jgi:hypothetical protein